MSVAFRDMGDAEMSHGIIRAQFVVETAQNLDFVKRLLNATKRLSEEMAKSTVMPRWTYRLNTLLGQGYHDLEVLMGRPATKMHNEHHSQLLRDKPTSRELSQEPDKRDLFYEPPGLPYDTMKGKEVKPEDLKRSGRHKRQLGVIPGVVATVEAILGKQEIDKFNHKVDLVVNASEATTNASRAMARSIQAITEAISDIRADKAVEELATMGNMILDVAFRHQWILQRQTNGIENLRKGILTPQAIPVEQMEATISQVQNLARRIDPNLEFPGKTTLEAYSLRSHVHEAEGTLRVTVEFPLTKKGEDKTYMLKFVPGPIWKDFPEAPVLPDPEESILLTDGFSAALLTEYLRDRYCITLGGRSICEATVNYKNLEKTCLGALYKGNVGKALKLCPLKQAPLEPRIIPMGANTFLITSIYNVPVTISCKTKENRLRPITNTTSVIGSKVITIEEGCHLETDKVYVKPEKVQSLHVTKIFMPDLQEIPTTLWDKKEDSEVLKKVAMASANVAEALKLDSRAQQVLELAKQANISEDYSFLLGIINNTLVAPVVTTAESGLTFAEDLVGSATSAVDIFTHPTGILAFGAALLGLFLLVGLTFLVVKSGICSYTGDTGDCNLRCREIRREMQEESERVLQEAKIYANKASYEAYRMMKSRCTCGGPTIQAVQ